MARCSSGTYGRPVTEANPGLRSAVKLNGQVLEFWHAAVNDCLSTSTIALTCRLCKEELIS